MPIKPDQIRSNPIESCAMLKTIKLTNSIFHGFFFVVELDMFQDLEALISHAREKLCALFSLHNMQELLSKAKQIEIKSYAYGTIQEVMLSNESIISLFCKEPSDKKPMTKENFLSESVNY